MAVGSGLGASVGFSPESVFGTYVAPAKFYEFDTEDVKKTRPFVQGGGLAAGRMAKLASRRTFITEAASGSVGMEVVNKGMGLLLQHLFGSAATPAQQSSTPAYLQTHTLVDNVGKSLTMQEGVPDTSGTVRVQTFKGGKITAGEFSCNVNENLHASWELDFQKYSEVESLATVSYPSAATAFHWGQMAVKLGTYASEASVTGVKNVTCRVERGQAVERYYAGASGLKAEPIMNTDVAVTGTIDIDYVTKADFVDRFHGDSSTAMVLEWVGPLIASTFFQTFRLKLPAVFFTGDTPVVDGPDLIDISVPFEAQLDGTNPLVTCEYMTTDTTL